MNSAPLTALPLSYYEARLTHEYSAPNSPNLNALLGALLGKFNDVTTCLASFQTVLALSTAVGAQLDFLGSIVGASRTVGFQPSNGVSPVLDDPTYRLYIQAVIGQNQWDGTIDGLYPLWAALFPGGSIVIEDNQNMTASVVLTGGFTSIVKDLITNGYIVPRPEGVQYTYSFGTLPYFGFGYVSGYIAGFGTGYWI